MRQIWKISLMKKWKRQKNANVNKNSHCCINQKNYLINFVFTFTFVLKRTLNVLFSNNRNRQIIYKWFCFIFILNRRNDVNFILHFNFLSLRLLFNINRNFSRFFEKFILNLNMFCFENIKQFLILEVVISLSSFFFSN